MAGRPTAESLSLALLRAQSDCAVQGNSRVKASDGVHYGQAVLEAPYSSPDGARPLVSPPAEDFSSVLLLDSIRQSLIRQVSVASL